MTDALTARERWLLDQLAAKFLQFHEAHPGEDLDGYHVAQIIVDWLSESAAPQDGGSTAEEQVARSLADDGRWGDGNARKRQGILEPDGVTFHEAAPATPTPAFGDIVDVAKYFGCIWCELVSESEQEMREHVVTCSLSPQAARIRELEARLSAPERAPPDAFVVRSERAVSDLDTGVAQVLEEITVALERHGAKAGDEFAPAIEAAIARARAAGFRAGVEAAALACDGMVAAAATKSEWTAGIKEGAKRCADRTRSLALAPPAPGAADPPLEGHKIIEGLRDAIAGGFSRVTLGGQVWVREGAADPLKEKA